MIAFISQIRAIYLIKLSILYFPGPMKNNPSITINNSRGYDIPDQGHPIPPKKATNILIANINIIGRKNRPNNRDTPPKNSAKAFMNPQKTGANVIPKCLIVLPICSHFGAPPDNFGHPCISMNVRPSPLRTISKPKSLYLSKNFNMVL